MRLVWIIGLGGIGIRHFQSLVQAKYPIHFVLTDTNAEIQETIAKWKEDAPHHMYTWVILNDPEIPLAPDLLIIATSSGPRFTISQKLISKGVLPKFILLEKFLFTNEFEYAEFLKSEWSERTYVNTPRRLYQTYQDIRLKIDDLSSPLTMNVYGNNWGIGCNSVHFLDVFSFLGEVEDYNETNVSLVPGWSSSKRSGYIEFSGLISLRSANKQIVLQDFTSQGPVWILVVIQTPKWYIEVRESEREVHVRNILTGELERFEFQLKYQSELTLPVFEMMVSGQNCGLPSFKHSSKSHLIILRLLRNHAEKFGWNENALPIT